MKKWFALFALLGTILWTAPATYTDGTLVPAQTLSAIVFRLYVDGVEFASVKGVLKWTGTLPQKVGESKSYTATAEIDGQPSTRSAQTDPVVFAWFVPLNKPGNVTIQLSP